MTDDDHDGGKYDDREPPEPDAFFAWALGPARAAYFSVSGEVEWLPVLVELHDITVNDFADGVFDGGHPIAGWQSLVQVHDVFRYLQERIDAPMPVVPAQVTEAFFEVRRTNAAVRKHLRSVYLGSATPLDTPSESPSAPFDPPGGPPEPIDPPDPSALATSVTGIIDDGIAFLNERFRDNFVSTRFHSVWVQTGGGGFPGGFVITKPAIDADLLQLFDNAADEADFYAAAGVLDFAEPNIHQSLGLSRTHGAAVTDAATGDRQTAATTNRPIVAVQLPTDAVKDPSLSLLGFHIMFGLAFLIWETKKIAADHGVTWLPLAINLSFGNIAGPHNGRSALELWMDWLIGGWRAAVGPVELVIASGNNRESRTHAVVGFKASGDSVALPWRVLPDDKTISSVQLWMPPPAPTPGPPRVRMRVVVPGGSGAATPWLDEGGGTVSWLDGAGDPICRLHSAFDVLAGRTVFTVWLQPTETLDTFANGAPTGPVATSGVWTIEIENHALSEDERIEAWIARDDTPFTYPRLGRQSYFDAACHRRLEDGGFELPEDDPACMVKRDGTISGIATGCEPVVIGGFLRREREMADYASGGPTSTAPCPGSPARTGPDAVAVSDDSRDHRGAIAAGTYSGSAVALDGTSIAAPAITRLVADRMAVGLPAGRAAIQGLGALLAEPYPVERIGGGAITTPPAHPVARYVPWPWIWMPPP